MQNYDAGNIKVLKGLEAVRKRPSMYIGDTSSKGLHHLIYEVVDNSIDEYMAGYCSIVKIIINKDGSVIVDDNGRGIPVTEHPTEKISAATVVLTVLHAGGKFDKDTYKVSGGLHGVGISVVNALSSDLKLLIKRDGHTYEQKFQKGIPEGKIKEIGSTNRNGTRIEFYPDESIFTETVEFQKSILIKRFKEVAYLNSKLTIEFEDKRENFKDIFHFEGGLKEFVSDINKNIPLSEIKFFEGKADDIEIDIALVYCDSDKDIVLTFVNNIKTKDGGSHEVGFRSAITRCLASYISKNANTKDKNIKIIGDDAKEGLVAIVSIRMPEPQFEGQTKGKLGSSYVRPLVQKFFSENFNKYLEENPLEAKAITAHVILAARGRDAAKRAKELIKKKDSMSFGTLPGKLADCQSKDPEISEIYLVEGDSAGGSAKQGRTREFQAILPLKGKILNVEKSNLNKILKSEEIKNMITALGCGISEDFNEDKLRYHKIIIMTDADIDGSHIQTLLMTFFYRFLKPLIEKGYLYLAQPPLYKYKKGKNEIYLKDDTALNNFLIENGVGSLEFKTMGKNDLVELLKKIYYYKIILKELAKRFALPQILQFMIENLHSSKDQNDINFNNSQNIFKDIEKELNRLEFNILKKEINENSIILFIQTNNGLEELIINNELLESTYYTEAISIYKQILDIITDEIKVKNLIPMLDGVLAFSKKGSYIQRYKGLGEMNPDQLWETTMDPDNRRLLKIVIDNDEKANDTFVLFMGDEVESRKAYIELHAKDVKNLDI